MENYTENYYQVYKNGVWIADFDTYKGAESYVNSIYSGAASIEIIKKERDESYEIHTQSI